MGGHFGKFDDAISGLMTLDRCVEGFQLLKQVAIRALHDGHRFYLPEASHVLGADKPVGEEYKHLIRLPFECVCLLSEQVLTDDHPVHRINGGESASTWRITIAFNAHGDFNKKIRFAYPGQMDESAIIVLTMIKDPRAGAWVLFPATVVFEAPQDKHGYFSYLCDSGIDYSQLEQEGLSISGYFHDDLLSVTNLCAMLGLANVSHKEMLPPPALNKKRTGNAKRELLSYHVLTVNGEEWHARGSNSGTRSGVRSHVRRGHIRRLPDGERCVWVRASMVHGSVAGFVSKDYHVRPPLERTP